MPNLFIPVLEIDGIIIIILIRVQPETYEQVYNIQV